MQIALSHNVQGCVRNEPESASLLFSRLWMYDGSERIRISSWRNEIHLLYSVAHRSLSMMTWT